MVYSAYQEMFIVFAQIKDNNSLGFRESLNNIKESFKYRIHVTADERIKLRQRVKCEISSG